MLKKLLVALLACASVFFSQRLLVVSNAEPNRSIASRQTEPRDMNESTAKPIKTASLF